MNAPCHSGAVRGDKDRSLCQLIHDAQNHLNAVKGLGLLLGNSSTHPRALMYRDCLQSVSDNGVGTHTCASGSATPVTQKSGHGLAICHRLANELGATFELSDAVPTGLTARIDVTLEHDKGMSS
jgi:two-component sensor histidine kinase